MSGCRIDVERAKRQKHESAKVWAERVLNLEDGGPGDWNYLMDFFQECNLPEEDRKCLLLVMREKWGDQSADAASTWF